MNLDNSKSFYILVGKNGCGKSTALKKLVDKIDSAFFIDEDGIAYPPFMKPKVKVDYFKKEYIFQELEYRGTKDNIARNEIINSNVWPVINYVKSVLNKLELFRNKSKGQQKLYNLFSNFNEYSLNNVDYICLDEPENYLDESYIKEVAKLIRLLINCEFKVRLATHSVRLLTELKCKIEDIVMFNKHQMYQITVQDIAFIFNKCCSDLESLRRNLKIDIDGSMAAKLKVIDNDMLFQIYLNQVIHNETFYKCLFNEQIIIVEGSSEFLALGNIKHLFENTTELFTPNGKVYVPFFVSLFLALNKQIIAIIDSDLKDEQINKNSYAYVFTEYLKELERESTGKLALIIQHPDFEGHYNISVKNTIKALGLSKNMGNGEKKIFAAMSFFSDDRNLDKLFDEINKKIVREHNMGSFLEDK